MRKRQVWRYYCEFCKKAGCSGGHMRKHEAGCTGNPNRTCSMHAMLSDGTPQQPIDLLKAVLLDLAPNWLECIASLRDAAGQCPACILAAIRQADLSQWKTLAPDWEGYGKDAKLLPDEMWLGTGHLFGFDFKAELKSAWNDHNEAIAEKEFY